MIWHIGVRWYPFRKYLFLNLLYRQMEKEKSEWKQQYQKRKGYFKEYYQKHKDVMDTNNKKNAKKYREEYKQLKKGKKSELEKRIEELERLVKELIEYKQDKEVIIMDKNWKPLWYDIHDYKPDF